jgi:hypothetical protein
VGQFDFLLNIVFFDNGSGEALSLMFIFKRGF